MGKKKKKKKAYSILYDMDESLNQTYEELMNDIKRMQVKLAVADAKAKKKLKKKRKNDPRNAHLYNNDAFRAFTRYQILEEMEGGDFFSRVERMLNDIAPVVILIARLVAALILSILSMDIVRIKIKPETLARLESIYTLAMAIG